MEFRFDLVWIHVDLMWTWAGLTWNAAPAAFNTKHLEELETRQGAKAQPRTGCSGLDHGCVVAL